MPKDSSAIDLSRVIMLMGTMSDNTAALWLQKLAGTGTAINAWLAANGFDSTRMNSRTPGRQGNWEIYGWGQTTPREMARLLTMIREEKAVSPAASQQMYRTLTRIYWNGQALSQIPPGAGRVQVGRGGRARSEVVPVNAPSGTDVFSVITKENADTSWAASNEAWILTRKISALLRARFEPKYAGTPLPARSCSRRSGVVALPCCPLLLAGPFGSGFGLSTTTRWSRFATRTATSPTRFATRAMWS